MYHQNEHGKLFHFDYEEWGKGKNILDIREREKKRNIWMKERTIESDNARHQVLSVCFSGIERKKEIEKDREEIDKEISKMKWRLKCILYV